MESLGKPVLEEHGNLSSSFTYTQKFSFPKESKILDVGCHFGSLLYNLHEEGYSNVYGIDVIESAVETGKKKYPAIAEKLADTLKQDLGRTSKIEGKDAGDWVLIDAGDVIVHVFRPEVREFYQIEKMWMGGETPAS